MSARIVGVLLWCLALPAAAEPVVDVAASGSAPAGSVPATTPQDAAAVEADIASQEISGAAKQRLDAARTAVVQIRGFFGGSASSAFHGSGFVVDDGRRIVTNYHVVAPAVLFPQQYRLEYTASDGRTGALSVQAIDIRNDLAVVAAADLQLPPLRLRTAIPERGERAWSIGFPLNLGLTITEGVANGLVENSIEQRIHYTGAINGGMSGGPALDRHGLVYGVNVSVVTGQQLIGFVVPAKHLPALLARAREPLERTQSARQLRQLVTAQVLAYEAEALGTPADGATTQPLGGYVLPTRMSAQVECRTVDERGLHARVRVEALSCSLAPRLLLQRGLSVGGIAIQHRLLRSRALHPLQFARQVNRLAAAQRRQGQAAHVAPYACQSALVSLDGFDGRVATCVRQYRLFPGLYDLEVTVIRIDDPRQALVSRLMLTGVAFESGVHIVERYLGALQWKP